MAFWRSALSCVVIVILLSLLTIASKPCQDFESKSFFSFSPFLEPELIFAISSLVHTILPQKKQGPVPSCSHTMRPHVKQFAISLCFVAWHSQEWRPSNILEIINDNSHLPVQVNIPTCQFWMNGRLAFAAIQINKLFLGFLLFVVFQILWLLVFFDIIFGLWLLRFGQTFLELWLPINLLVRIKYYLEFTLVSRSIKTNNYRYVFVDCWSTKPFHKLIEKLFVPR